MVNCLSQLTINHYSSKQLLTFTMGFAPKPLKKDFSHSIRILNLLKCIQSSRFILNFAKGFKLKFEL